MHVIATFVDWTRNHILSPNSREKHQSSWGRISQDRFLPSWKFHDIYIVSGKTFLSGILNSGYCLQFEGYIEGNYLYWVFQWQWSSLPLDDGLRNHVWGLVIGGDRLTSGNQGIQIRQIWRVSRSRLGRRPGTPDRKRSSLGILGLGDIRRWSIGLVLLWFVILTGSLLSCMWEWSFL